MHDAYVCVSTQDQAVDVCVTTQDQTARHNTQDQAVDVCVTTQDKAAVQPQTSSGEHLNKGVLLAPLILPNTASSWRPPGPRELASLLSKPTSWQPPGLRELTSLHSKPTSWQPPEPGELACLLFQPASWQPPWSCKLTKLLIKPTNDPIEHEPAEQPPMKEEDKFELEHWGGVQDE